MSESFSIKNPVVIVGNGEFPSHPIPLNHLKNAGTIICTDGSADQLMKHNVTPNAIIGDMDSTKLKKDDFKGIWNSSPDQNKTDLQKTLDWCIGNDLNDVTVLGTMGRREDHSLGNLHVLDEISIVAIEHVRSISTFGLKYELNNEQFPPACNGISNEAENDEFFINTSHPVWLFINHIE